MAMDKRIKQRLSDFKILKKMIILFSLKNWGRLRYIPMNYLIMSALLVLLLTYTSFFLVYNLLLYSINSTPLLSIKDILLSSLLLSASIY